MKKPALISFLVCMMVIEATAITRYVTPSGAGTMNGSTWANAMPGTSLQAAINASAPGDEVWVMTGSYFTTTGTNRNISFSMVNGVAIYGSFNGTETTLSQRNFSCGFTSVLSAEINLPGIADNSYHVFNNASLNTTALLDGFTIRDANANFDLLGNDNRSLGGGMLNNAANSGTCTPTIRNCFFTNNSALFGGGIFDHGQNGGNASPVITNCIFAVNTATGGGGAIDNFGYNGNASPIITNSVFYSNTATDRAGAIYCWGGGNGNASPVILNSVFVNNSSVDGGAIVSDRLNFSTGSSGTATPIVRNCIFWGNTASGTGPQFITFGAATFQATYTLIDITNQNPPHTITGAGTGNSFTTPSFINSNDADGADNCWLTNDDGLQLQSASNGIDAGENTGVLTYDIRNYSRISNGVVDMGAYEFNSTVLPVTLLNFYGRTDGTVNRLSWNTVNENNNRIFEIQRSIDGIQFDKLGERAGAVNSSGMLAYHFTDNRLTRAPQHYYRLKQIDLDGRYSYSKIILMSAKNYNKSAQVIPNPVHNSAVILFQQDLQGEVFLLLNSNGQLVTTLFFKGKRGEVDMTGKAAGMYWLISNKLGVTIKMNKAGH